MYPTYALQVHGQDGWEQVEGTEASNRPHHYDELRKTFESLVRGTRPFKAHFVEGFGYRIAVKDATPLAKWRTVDEWHV